MTDLSRLFRPNGPFFLIAGPCVLEGSELNLQVAREVARVGQSLGVQAIYKASFDKANRTSLRSHRGPGLTEGLALLREVREEVGLPLTTDIHVPGQADPAATVVDLLQIPAFLCRQTDLILAAAETGRAINLKKGQWMAAEDMAHQVEKAREGGAAAVAVTERGTAFGYHNLVVDMRSFAEIKGSCDCATIFDASHSVQRPGAGDARSDGEPEHIPALAGAATAAGADALFVEVHPEPRRAPSDAASMLRLDRLEPLVRRVLAVRETVRTRVGAHA
jgi:2-dehydro-3-deoxyphosphooctonate aldolase (KDO 8-P synthase)